MLFMPLLHRFKKFSGFPPLAEAEFQQQGSAGHLAVERVAASGEPELGGELSEQNTGLSCEGGSIVGWFV